MFSKKTNWNKKWLKFATHFSEVGWKYIPPDTHNPRKEFNLGPKGRQCEWCDFVSPNIKEVEDHAIKTHYKEYISWKNKEQRQSAETRIYDFYFLEMVEPDILRESPRYGKGFSQSDYADTMSDPGSPDKDVKDTEWERIIENLHQAKRDLVSSMGKDYIEDLRFSISCEIRHLWHSEGAPWASSATQLPSGWMEKEDNWLTKRLKVAESIEASQLPEDNPELEAVKNTIIKLKNVDLNTLPENLRKNYEKQINELENYLSENSKTGLKKTKDQAHREYLEHLIDHYIVNQSHQWRVSKVKGMDDEDDDEEHTDSDYWTEWKKDQLSRMAELVINTSSSEWKTIIEKAKKLKFLLCKDSNVSKFVFPDDRALRYRKPSGEGGHYYQSYLKGHEAGFTNREFSIFCTAALLDVDWSGQYGGPGWAHIASMANRIDELFRDSNRDSKALGKMGRKISVDQAHNLQHNNGSAFTKVDMIYNGSMFEEALNFKASSTTTMYDLLQKTSPQLHEIGQFYLYNAGFNPPKDAIARVKGMSQMLTEKSRNNLLCDFLMNTDFKTLGSELTNVENEELQKLKQIPNINEAIKYYDLYIQGGSGNEQVLEQLFNAVGQKLKAGKELTSSAVNSIKKIKKLEEKSKISGLRDLLWASPIDYSCLAQNKFFGPGDRGYFMHAIGMIAHSLPTGTLDKKQIYESFYKYQKFTPDEAIEIITDLDSSFKAMQEMYPVFLGDETSEETDQDNITETAPDEIDSRMQTESVPGDVTFFDEPTQQGAKTSYRYIYKMMKESQTTFPQYMEYGPILTSQLLGLAQNTSLKMDSYYMLFDIAQKKEDYDVLLALAKNPSIKKTKDQHGLQLKQILMDLDFPKWFIDKKLPPKGNETVEWPDTNIFDMDKISSLFGVLQDNISATTNALIDTNIEEYEYKGKNLSKVIGTLSINDTKFATLEAKETSDKCRLTLYGDNWKGSSFLPIDDIEEIAKNLIDIIHKVEEGKPVTIGTGAKLPALNAKLILTSEIKDLMDRILKETSSVLEKDDLFGKLTFSYNLDSYSVTEDNSDIKSATYIYNTPNQIFIVFNNEDEGISVRLNSVLGKDEFNQMMPFGASGLVIKETAIKLSEKIKQFNTTKLDQIGNELISKIKLMTQIKMNKIFSFPVYKAVDIKNVAIFSCLLQESSLIVQKVNGESKTFFTINVDEISEFILEGMPTAADAYKKVDKIINSIASNLVGSNIPVKVKKESEQKYRYMLQSDEFTKLVYVYDTNLLIVKIYPISGYSNFTIVKEFSLNDNENNIISMITNLFIKTAEETKNTKNETPSKQKTKAPVPETKQEELSSATDPFFVSSEVADYLKTKIQDENIDVYEVVSSEDKKQYRIFTLTDDEKEVALITLTFTQEEVIVNVHEYENYIKTTQEATFPKSYTKSDVAKTIATFLNSYIVYIPGAEVKKKKKIKPEQEPVQPVAPAVAPFVSKYVFTNPATWGIDMNHPWVSCLKAVDDIYSGLSSYGSNMTVVPEAGLTIGALKIKIKIDGYDVGSVKTNKTKPVLEYDDVNGYFKSFNMSMINSKAVSNEIIDYFTKWTKNTIGK
jgi:hypothetical protein